MLLIIFSAAVGRPVKSVFMVNLGQSFLAVIISAYVIPGCKLLKPLYKIRTKHDLACSAKNIMLLHLRVVAIEVLKKLSKKSCSLHYVLVSNA